MSHCYPIAGVISLKPCTGAWGGTKLLYMGFVLGIFTYLIIIHPRRLWINNFPKVIPVNPSRIELEAHLRHFCSPQTKNCEKPDHAVYGGGKLRSWKGIPHFSPAPCVGVGWVPPQGSNLQPLAWVPQTGQTVFLQKWFFVPTVISGGHHLGSVSNDPGSAATI